uniref:Uncharacterized protein n=1 Tax=Vespula pensylvanica TaxID=30213 RepID=A0A834PA08_VESPE|nr:hypothetical protein H0235_002392 [Vespula pensylvanica]
MEIAGLEADNRNWAIASTTYRHFGLVDKLSIVSFRDDWKPTLCPCLRVKFQGNEEAPEAQKRCESHHVEVVASRDSRDNGDSILKSKFPDNMPVREKFGPQR